MTTQEKIDLIGSYGYGVYTIPDGYCVADPLDDSDGYYLCGLSLDEICTETLNGALRILND